MDINLKEDSIVLSKWIENRISSYDPDCRIGPGDNGAPISSIEFGFEYYQYGWVALVFDTRPGARPDGEWNSYIEANALEFSSWSNASEKLDNEQTIEILLPTDIKVEIDPEGNISGNFEMIEDGEDYIAHWIGEMLKSSLLHARDSGLLNMLPLAEDCVIGVEHHDGAYGWPGYENLDTIGRAKNDRHDT